VNSRKSLSKVTHVDITQKFKMAAVKPEIHVYTFVHGISKLLYMVASKFHVYLCYTFVFGVGNTERLVEILSDV